MNLELKEPYQEDLNIPEYHRWYYNLFCELEIRLAPRFISYKPIIPIKFSLHDLEVESVYLMDDLLDVFKLRFQYYFNQEVGDESYIYDLDDCDHLAQHMVIKNKVSKQVICQFRLQLSRDCRDYYLNKFFHYKNFPHGILEVSKLYIHPDQRNNLDLVEVLKKVINIFQNKTRVSSIIYFLDFKMNQKEKILNMEKLLNLPSLKWQNCELKTDFQSHHPNTKSAQDHEIELNSVQDFMVQQSCGIIGEGFVNPEHNCSHLVCLSNPFESKN